MLGIAHVDGDEDRHGHDDKDERHEAVAEEFRKPAFPRVRVDGAHRGFGAAPDIRECVDNVDRDVIHHKSEERLVGVPLRLEVCGNECPQRAKNGGGEEHEKEQECIRKAARVNHQEDGCESAHEDLSLTADVPEAHAEGGHKGEANAEQNHRIPKGCHEFEPGLKGSGPHDLIDFERGDPREGVDENGVHNERQQDSDNADEPGLIPPEIGASLEADEGLFYRNRSITAHLFLSPFRLRS